MNLRKYSKGPLPTPDQSRRQSHIVRSTWSHFGERDLAIAFLNTRHDGLEGLPLQLAIDSDQGLERVETVLNRLRLEA